MTPNLDIAPDIKVSVKQTFGIDSKMEVEAFSKKMNMFLILIKAINLIETRHFAIISGFAFNKEF